jgi:hypothetical protein
MLKASNQPISMNDVRASTVHEQIEFINEIREAFDREERQRIAMIREPEHTAQLLKDIHENLIAVRNWRAADTEALEVADKCNDCPVLITTENLADNERYDVVLDPKEIVCISCADKRLARLEESSMGIP